MDKDIKMLNERLSRISRFVSILESKLREKKKTETDGEIGGVEKFDRKTKAIKKMKPMKDDKYGKKGKIEEKKVTSYDDEGDDDSVGKTEPINRDKQKIKKVRDHNSDDGKKKPVKEGIFSLEREIENLLEKKKKSSSDKKPLPNGKVSGEKFFNPPYKGIKADRHYKPINTDIKKQKPKITK